MKNIFKKFVVLSFILLFTNNIFAEENIEKPPIPLECVSPQVLNKMGDACINVVIEPESLICVLPQILNEIGDTCINPEPEVIVCITSQTLVDGICIDPVIEPISDPVDIHLQIISGMDSLYDNDISVTACDSDNNPETPDIATPYCALVQSGVSSDWFGLWIDSIGDFSNDFSTNLYWMWLANLNIDNTNLNSSYNFSPKQYKINADDKILFYFNTNPLNIEVSNLNPVINNEITISVKELGLDSSWNPVWLPSLSSDIVISYDSFSVDENGEFKINIINTDPIIIKGKKRGYIDSSLITITPIVSTQEEVICINGATNPPSCDTTISSGGGENNNKNQKDFSVDDALSFLLENKKSASTFVYDWIAISAGAGNNSDLKSSLVNYLKSNPINSSTITDYERRAMALMALGINPYDGSEIDYIKKIIDSFDDVQIGDTSLFNDDIFGLIVLQNVGYDEDNEMISKIISYIISKQSPGGSWGSVDMTSAAIMALNNFDNVNEVENAVSKAENYLLENQNNDGGFDNIFSTSWAIQALSQNNLYQNEIEDGIRYLANYQNSDGGIDYEGGITNRTWATSYTIPAVLGLSWNDILESFNRENEEVTVLSPEEIETESPLVLITEEKKEIEIFETPIQVDKVKIENNIKNKEDVKFLVKKEIDNNLLSANAVGVIEDNILSQSLISRILSIIKTPFIWLWIVFGF